MCLVDLDVPLPENRQQIAIAMASQPDSTLTKADVDREMHLCIRINLLSAA